MKQQFKSAIKTAKATRRNTGLNQMVLESESGTRKRAAAEYVDALQKTGVVNDAVRHMDGPEMMDACRYNFSGSIFKDAQGGVYMLDRIFEFLKNDTSKRLCDHLIVALEDRESVFILCDTPSNYAGFAKTARPELMARLPYFAPDRAEPAAGPVIVVAHAPVLSQAVKIKPFRVSKLAYGAQNTGQT